jgi:hypothetical protein
MLRRTLLSRAAASAALAALLAGATLPALAQDTATPSAGDAVATRGDAPRPAHIHTGNCDNIGDVVAPLTDLTAPDGDRVGQANRAILAQSSFTNVPLPLDAILAGDHAINIHLSAEDIGFYLACGELGGVLDPGGALTIGLREQNDAGFTGIAYLAPSADGASTDVSVFVAQSDENGIGGEMGSDDSMIGDDGMTGDDDMTGDDSMTGDDDMTDDDDMTPTVATPDSGMSQTEATATP